MQMTSDEEHTQAELVLLVARRQAVQTICAELRTLLKDSDPILRIRAQIWRRQLSRLCAWLLEQERQAAAFQRRDH